MLLTIVPPALPAQLPIAEVEGQPLAANVLRLLTALDYLGRPLPNELGEQLRAAAGRRDAEALQQMLDAASVVDRCRSTPSPGSRWAAAPHRPSCSKLGFTPVLIKVLNQSTGTPRLRIVSKQAGAVYSGVSELSMRRQQQPMLRENQNTAQATDRFLSVEVFSAPPMTGQLSGLEVEYAHRADLQQRSRSARSNDRV